MPFDTPRRWYRITGHPEKKRREIWRRLRRNRPALARWLEEDPFIKEMVETFGCDVLVQE